ncbi:universal stress protein [Kallotenue papyrolyticum]|uniref:universal stress protein n=1 Tax=Kallotenue papyrolyticum TaxID=1325125 RepID=UPI000492987B|nr:universal stress protein [Kallotenue papyrolyticum]
MLNLLIYVDGSSASQAALEYIAPITRDADVATTILTAQSDPARGVELFGRAASRLRAAMVRHVNRVEAGDTALINEAQTGAYDLAVFGPLRERWSRWLRMRPSSTLSAQLPISSLLVRGQARQISRMLICAGGDRTVIADARLAARLARRTGASATILHVLSQIPMIFGVRTPQERLLEAFEATGAPEVANMRAAAEVLAQSGVAAELKLRIGLVIDEIVAELRAGGYDLLVVGAHRSQTLIERLLLEDVTRDILGQSPVPVLVVKERPATPPNG